MAWWNSAMQRWVVPADSDGGVSDHLPLGDVCLVRAHWLHVPLPTHAEYGHGGTCVVLPRAMTHHHGTADRGTSLAGPDT